MKKRLQPLFAQPIQSVTPLDPGYEDHGSDVWLVETPNERAVVRSSRMREAAESLNDFWWGCRKLFGIEPWRTFDLEAIHGALGQAGGFRVPRVLRKGVIEGREFVVVEWVEGAHLRSFGDLSQSALVQFGKSLAAVHARTYDFCGHVTRRLAYPLSGFHPRVAKTMRELARRFYAKDRAIQDLLEPMCDAVVALPAPEAATLVMVDMDLTQFLVSAGDDLALVDAEACGVGPRELDFVALEYCLDAGSAAEIAKGYESVLALPDLSRVRAPYRYLYRLLSVQGSVPMDEWLKHPAYF